MSEVKNKQPTQKQEKPQTIRMGGRMMIMGQKPKNFKKSMGRLLNYLKPYAILIILSMLFAAGSTVFSIMGPKYIGRMTDAVATGAVSGSMDYSYITAIGLMLAAFYVVGFVLNFIQHYLMTGISAKTSKKLRTQIEQKVTRLPLRHFDDNSTGDTMSRVSNDVDTISQSLNQSLAQSISSLATIVGMVIMMLTLSPILTLVPIGTIPLSIVLITGLVKISQKYFKMHHKKLGEVNGHIEEIYSAQLLVNVFNYKGKARKKFEGLNNELRGSALKSQFISGLNMPFFALVGNLGFIAVCVLGGYLATKGAVTLGVIVSFMTYVRQFNQPINNFASIVTQLQSTAAAGERVFEFLDTEEQEQETNKQVLTEVEGEVVFENVNFGYTPDKQIIFDFNMKAEKGQKIAIVGPTGAGKTTIVNLLMRFYDVDSGRILIDGVPTNEIYRDSVRSAFGMVLQDAWVFEGTIKENVAYSKKDASIEEIIRACKAANIDHFIRTLPSGYNTVLNDEFSLSAGQKQLLTIARAMVKNAPMLILDEATSSVDTRTEVLIQQAMDRLMTGRTSFIIAHRLSTIKNADLILVMKDGSIIEQGTHDELLNQKGFYAELYNSQFSEDAE